MARERSASAEAEKDSKDSIVKQIAKPAVTSSASANRGRERERRRRGGSASSSSSSSGSSSSSSSSRSSSGSGSRSSSSSSSSGSSTSSSSSSASDRGGARGGGSSRGNGRKAKSVSPRRSKSPITGNKSNTRKDSRDRNNRRSKDRSRRSADRDQERDRDRDRNRDNNTDLVASKKNSKDHGRSSRTRSRSPITRSPRRGGRNDNHVTNRRRERSPTPKPVRIHVGRLTRNVTKEHVMEIFSCFGEVKHVEFPTDRIHPSFGRGIAYVEYATPEDCENAMKQMDGGQIDGQEVACSPVHPQRVFPPIRRKSPPMRRPRWRSPPFNRFNHRGGGNFRSPIRRRSPRRRSRSPIRRRRRSLSSDSSR